VHASVGPVDASVELQSMLQSSFSELQPMFPVDASVDVDASSRVFCRGLSRGL
jgi:hypothetical protein